MHNPPIESSNHIYLTSLLRLLTQIGELKDPMGLAKSTKLIDLMESEQINGIMAYIAVRHWEIHHGFQIDMDYCLALSPEQIVDAAVEAGVLLDPVAYENHVADIDADLTEYIHEMIENISGEEGDISPSEG